MIVAGRSIPKRGKHSDAQTPLDWITIAPQSLLTILFTFSTVTNADHRLCGLSILAFKLTNNLYNNQRKLSSFNRSLSMNVSANMSDGFTRKNIINLPISERAKLIHEHASQFAIPSGIDDADLQVSYQLSNSLRSIASDIVDWQIQTYGNVLDNQNQSIRECCGLFSDNFIKTIPKIIRTPEQMSDNPRNLYELCGASLFTESNAISRSLSTRMGQLWEEIAKISPYTISPEQDFGVKLKGIDIVIWQAELNQTTFTQLKTTPGTLTGSQRSRSQKELEIHESALFATAFCLGSWHFSSPDIPRACGADFWSKIGLDYNLILENVKSMILEIENAYIEFKTD